MHKKHCKVMNVYRNGFFRKPIIDSPDYEIFTSKDVKIRIYRDKSSILFRAIFDGDLHEWRISCNKIKELGK